MAKRVGGPIQSEAQLFEGWARELAQRHAEDVVLAAALFKPNAAGNWNLSWGGFGQRQKLKAAGVYLAERVLLAVTPLDLYVVELLLQGQIHRTIRQWPRTDLRTAAVTAEGRTHNPRFPALLIANRTGRLLAEVQPVHLGPDTVEVLKLLITDHYADQRHVL
jgi:hypothetical protein